MGITMVGKNGRQTQHQNARKEPRRPTAAVPPTLSEQFRKFAQTTARATGHPVAFLFALLLIAVWIVSGPLFHYSDTWQLVINTGTTIITFLMVFLIQNTQNRDSMAVQLKLSELVLAAKGAENKFAAIENLSDEELERLHEQCRSQAEMTLDHLRRRRSRRGRSEFPAAAHGARTSRRNSQDAHPADCSGPGTIIPAGR
jgi:low affinity Fe/Cu permease